MVDGLKLYKNVMEGFTSSKIERIVLDPNDADTLITEMNNLAGKFSYKRHRQYPHHDDGH